MQYGKLDENNSLEYAPTNYGNILNFDRNIELLQANGFKPVVDTQRPEYDSFTHYATSKWIDKGDSIVKEWTVVAKDPEELQAAYNELSLKRGDIFEALILAKRITKTQIRAMIEQADVDPISKALYLNRFDEAIDFYRGHPLFELMSDALKVNADQLNRFFLTKDYKHLITATLTVVANPETSMVYINEEEKNSITAPYGTEVSIEVQCDGYNSHKEILTITEDATLSISLEQIAVEAPEEVVEEAETEEILEEVLEESDQGSLEE